MILAISASLAPRGYGGMTSRPWAIGASLLTIGPCIPRLSARSSVPSASPSVSLSL